MVVSPTTPASDLFMRRGALVLAIILMVVVAGVRFSDGSMLVAISRGASVSDPVFTKTSTQYVWDSPLKIALLRLLPPSVAFIAIVFACLAALPLLGLCTKDIATFWIFWVAIFLTPAFRLSIQNIGVGDGLPIACLCVIAATSRRWVVAAMFLVIALWHPQQSFFMGVSYLLAMYCYYRDFDYSKATGALAGLAIGAVVFFAYKTSLGFTYSGRAQYMTENVRQFITENISYAPLAFAPIAIWFLFLAPKTVRGRYLLATWVAVLGLVSLLTTDVTRAMTLISLPIVAATANLMFTRAGSLDWRKYVYAAIVMAMIPAYSWSGVDIFLWHDLVSDLRKWGFLGGGELVPLGQ